MHPTRKQFLEYAQYCGELMILEKAVKAHSEANQGNDNYCANKFWFGVVKHIMHPLVGWESQIDVLKNSDAYDVVYGYLYNILPNCKHDGVCHG